MKRNAILAIGLLLGIPAAALAQAETALQPLSIAYVLQAEGLGASRQEAVRRLAECGRDWIVIDSLFDGSEDGEYSADEIQQIRAGRHNRKVLAYLSVGEAEDYRPYWKREWDADRDGRPDGKAPSWLCDENPDWKGNYRVRYWDEAWQDIVLELLDRTMRAGFDGVYLDIVDAFESLEYNPARDEWMDHRVNADTGRSYREDMVRWVRRLAADARRQKPGFLVVPQNGAQLLEDVEYLATIDAIGIEDLFTDGDRPQESEHTQYVIGLLERAQAAGKPILVIEYGTTPTYVRISAHGAAQNRYVLLVTDRELKTLGQSGNLNGEAKNTNGPTGAGDGGRTALFALAAGHESDGEVGCAHRSTGRTTYEAPT
jgi:cysteinyl-tRNA synthetase